MATFKIEDLFGHGQTVPEPSHAKNKPMTQRAMGQVKPYQEHRTRAETEQLIKDILATAKKNMTLGAIARQMERTPSPHLRMIFADMVKAGELVETADTPNNERWIRYWYSLP